jgi:hypothetical protein
MAGAMFLSALHGSVRGLVQRASRPPIFSGAGKAVPVQTAYGWQAGYG